MQRRTAARPCTRSVSSLRATRLEAFVNGHPRPGHAAFRTAPAVAEMHPATVPHFAFFFINWATGLTMFWIRYRCVAVTQDAIYVLAGSRLSGGANPKSVVGTLPRHTQLGPVSGRWGQLNLLGERHWVKRRFQAEIAAADAEAGFTYAP